MTINIDGYEVEIKAKYTCGRNIKDVRNNKADTMAVLNTISLWARESAEWNSRMGCNATAKSNREASDSIYYVLDSKGYFDDV